MTAQGPSGPIPCPMCGSENVPDAPACQICGYNLQQHATNTGNGKCARCGSQVPPGYDFCPVCGLDQRRRLGRPATEVVRIHGEEGSADQAAAGQAGQSGTMQAMPPVTTGTPGPPPDAAAVPAAGYTVPAPGPPGQGAAWQPQEGGAWPTGLGPRPPDSRPPESAPRAPPPGAHYADPAGQSPPADRTMPAPSLGQPPADRTVPAPSLGGPPASPPADRTMPAPSLGAPAPPRPAPPPDATVPAPSLGGPPAPAPYAGGAPPPDAGAAPAQTGRTVFMDGPPLARPPEPEPARTNDPTPVPPGARQPGEDDLTMPAPSRLLPRAPRGEEDATHPESAEPDGPPRQTKTLVPDPDAAQSAGQPAAEPGTTRFSTVADPLGDAPPTLPGKDGEPAPIPPPEGQAPWSAPAPLQADPHEDTMDPQEMHRPAQMLSEEGDLEPVGPAYPGPAHPPVGPAHESGVPTAPGTEMARLVLVGRDGEEGQSFPMAGDYVAIGRTQGDVLFPEDRFMSPGHARVERAGDAYTLIDTGSINGAYLRIRGTASVFPGDLFMVGHQLLRLENVADTLQERMAEQDGTRLFGTPLKPAWGKLVLVGRGGIAGDEYYLRGAKVVFGRESGDILFPNDPFVSREHARVRLELSGSSMSVFLEDLGSANGTYIRIRGSSELRSRDTFRIGDQILRLRLDR